MFGNSDYGQLGDGEKKGRNNARKITEANDNTALPSLKKISAGYRYSLALSKDGKVYA